MSDEATAVAEAPAKEFEGKIKDLGDSIAGLTIKEAVDLKDYLKDAYGIEPAAGGAVMMAGPGGPSDSDEAEEKTAWDVILTSPGDQKIKVIKVLREATGLGLKEAKALADETPSKVKEGISKEDADALVEKLKEQGAEVEVK